MAGSVLARVPVVAGVAYIERVRRQPASFSVSLVAEPENRYFRHAMAVHANGEKVGYVAPEISVRYFEPLTAHLEVVTCSARRGDRSDHETSGVELLLDFTNLAITPTE